MRITHALTFALLLATTGSATAQNYPERPIRLLVTSTPGGSVDTIARIIGARLGEKLGQQIVVDNRPGAGGIVAAQVLAKAPADGHTLIQGTAPLLALNPTLHKSLPYDPVKDFAPISLIGSQDLVLVINPTLPVQSVKDLIALAKRRPGQLAYGSAGNGTGSHLSGELLKKIAGIDLLHVPYKGVASVLLDVTSGAVAMTFTTYLSSQGYVNSGKVKAIAVTGPQRSPATPDLPTMIEQGVTGFESYTWYGILAPAGTQRQIVGRLNSEISAILKQPETISRLSTQNIQPGASTPVQFARFIAAEIAKWRQVIQSAGIKPV
jgi:tripartite-type tricarboxylate transporter receptor subunit TctC